MNRRLPDPRLNLVYRLEATVGDPQDVGQISAGHRRIVPLTGGTFNGPELRGTLLPGACADWQTFLRTARRLVMSVTRWKLNAEKCSMSNHRACATEAWRFSNVSGAGRCRRK